MSFWSSAHRRAPVHKKNVLSFTVLCLVNCQPETQDFLDRLTWSLAFGSHLECSKVSKPTKLDDWMLYSPKHLEKYLQ